MLCSVLIPSRGRPERLKKTIRSILDTVSNPEEVEILVRLDYDDELTLSAFGFDLAGLTGLAPWGRIAAKMGPREAGYPSIGDFYNYLANWAKGRWIWIMNDDAYVAHVTDSPAPMAGTGMPWDIQLAALPTSGVIAQPECYQLGGSKYWGKDGGAFPLVPQGSWLPDHFLRGAAVDTWLDQLLRVKRGWQTKFLGGVAVVHERDADDVLADHRKV